MKSWNGYEIVDEKARKDIEKLQLLTGGEAINTIADYNSSKATAIVSTLNGETLVTNSSAAIPPRNIKLFGKSIQDSTPGNQLFDCNNYSENDVTGNGDIRPSVIIPVEVGNYTISRGNASDINIYLRKNINGDYGSSTPVNQNTTHSISLESDGNIIVYTDVGGELSLAIDIMVNKGTIALPWEPYTGGKPSPSIDYPQAIQSIGSGGSIGGKLIGENLIDVAGIYVTNWGVYQENGTRITVDGDKVTIEVLKKSNDIIIPLLKPTHSFCCSLNYTFSDGVEANTRMFNFRTKNGNVYGVAELPGTVIQFDSPEDTFIYRIGIGVGSSGGYFAVGTTITLTRSYLNETGNGFTPYIATQPFTALTPNGLPGIPVSSGGNYIDENGQQYVADYVDFERGKYVKKVMCSSLKEAVWNDVWNAYYYIDGTFLVYTNHFNNDAIKGDCEIICSHFVCLGESILTSEKIQCQNGQGGAFNIAFRVPTTLANSIEEWKQWISNNNMQLLFPLKTPIETDLTAEEIAQYQALCMNYPNTTIINDAGAYMEVEYVEDTKIYIDKLEKKHDEEIQTLKTAIIALGGTI